MPAEPDHADGEGHGGEQHQALGNHWDDARDHSPDGLAEVVALHVQLAQDQPDRGRDQQPGDVAQDRVDAGPELRLDQGEPAGLLGQLGGVGLAADPGGGERARAGHHEAAGHHRVAGVLVDGVGLAGEQRLVDLQAVGLGDLPVDGDLVAGPQLDQVAEDDLGVGQLGAAPVAPDPGVGLADDGEAVEGVLGP